MPNLRRIVMVRHGETDGESSVRFHGSGDVPLSDEGRAQARESARQLPGGSGDLFDLVVASPLSRAWEAARIIAPGAAIRLEEDFREVHFGAWEGLTKEEIEASDPARYRQWQAEPATFEFPEGERKAHFRARIQRGLEHTLAAGASSALVVAHKGVIRTITGLLTGTVPPQPNPVLGALIQLRRGEDGEWIEGRHSSNPPGLGDAPRG